MKVYLKIRELADRRKIQQNEFAEKIGVHVNTINNWFNGKTGINADYIPIIARILRVPITALFNADEDLKTLLEEPGAEYNKKDCEMCKAKDEVILALKENIELLKSR